MAVATDIVERIWDRDPTVWTGSDEASWLGWLAEPRRMQFEVGDGIWVRLIDVEAALAARSYEGDAQVVVELTDAFLPENAGRWRLGARGAERTNATA